MSELGERIAKRMLQWSIDSRYGCPQKDSHGNPSVEIDWNWKPEQTKQEYLDRANQILVVIAEELEKRPRMTDDEILYLHNAERAWLMKIGIMRALLDCERVVAEAQRTNIVAWLKEQGKGV